MTEFLQNIPVWGVVLTLAAFALGTWLNKKTGQAIFNPLLLGSIFVIVFLSLVQVPFGAYKESVSFLSYLLLPATVSLAVPLYEQWLPLKKNAAAVLCWVVYVKLFAYGLTTPAAWVILLANCIFVIYDLGFTAVIGWYLKRFPG